jgi:hypothetical protein
MRALYRTQALRDHLYTHFYCPGRPVAAIPTTTYRWHEQAVGPEYSPALLKEVGAYCVVAPTSRGVLVAHDSLEFYVDEASVVSPNSDPVEAGQEVRILLPRVLPRRIPGFVLVTGRQEPHGSQQLVRYYFNVRAGDGEVLAKYLIRSLDEVDVPCRFKFSYRADTYRCDGAVLYVSGDDWSSAERQVLDALRRSGIRLRDRTPAFTKPVAHGVGFAEDPGSGQSFGATRCELVARGLVDAYERRLRRHDDRVGAVLAALEGGGIDLARPYLGPGHADRYGCSHSAGASAPTHKPLPRVAGRRSDLRTPEEWPPSPLGIAELIARQLEREAITTATSAVWCAPDHIQTGTYRRISSDLYSGCAGVALFLGEVALASGQESFASLARRALGRAREALAAESSGQTGLFTGMAGVAYAHGEVGRLLEDDSLLEFAESAAAQVIASGPPDSVDVISGAAGSISAALALSRGVGGDALTTYAAALGEALLDRRTTHARGCSWRTLNRTSEYDLAGFAHGASGIAAALLELFAVTGDGRFGRVAADVLAYERSLYQGPQGGWPDLRGVRKGDPLPTSRGSTFWCHGASGIALARFRAAEIAPSLGPWREEALEAVDFLLAGMHASPRPEGCVLPIDIRPTLCHGTSGEALVLREAARCGYRPSAAQTRANALAEELCSNYGDWLGGPSRPGTRMGPGLMSGLAGIGHALLAMSGSRVSSVLHLQAGV